MLLAITLLSSDCCIIVLLRVMEEGGRDCLPGNKKQKHKKGRRVQIETSPLVLYFGCFCVCVMFPLAVCVCECVDLVEGFQSILYRRIFATYLTLKGISQQSPSPNKLKREQDNEIQIKTKIT